MGISSAERRATKPSCCPPPALGSTGWAGGRKIKSFVTTFPQVSLHIALMAGYMLSCPWPQPALAPGRSSSQEPSRLCSLLCSQLLMPWGLSWGIPDYTEQPQNVPSFASLLGSQEDGQDSGTHGVVQLPPCHLQPSLLPDNTGTRSKTRTTVTLQPHVQGVEPWHTTAATGARRRRRECRASKTRGDAEDPQSLPVGLPGGCAAPQGDAQHQTGPHQGQPHEMPPLPSTHSPMQWAPSPQAAPRARPYWHQVHSTARPSSCLPPRAASSDKRPSRPQRGSAQTPRCSFLAPGVVTAGTHQCHGSQPHTGLGTPRL